MNINPFPIILKILHAFYEPKKCIPSLIISFLYYNKKIRISMASIAIIEVDNKFLLIHNRCRKELLAPIGGVIKYRNEARHSLDEMQFEIEPRASTDNGLRNDLRGYIPGSSFSKFLAWFFNTNNLENNCLEREIKEELKHNKPLYDEYFSDCSLNLVRTVCEGPHSNKAHSYATFRYFNVYRVQMTNIYTDEDKTKFLNKIKNDNKLYLATKEEIENHRTNNETIISGSSMYLFSNHWHGLEPVKF